MLAYMYTTKTRATLTWTCPLSCTPTQGAPVSISIHSTQIKLLFPTQTSLDIVFCSNSLCSWTCLVLIHVLPVLMTKDLHLKFPCQTNHLRLYRSFGDINVDQSTLWLKYFQQFWFFKFYNIWPKIMRFFKIILWIILFQIRFSDCKW